MTLLDPQPTRGPRELRSQSGRHRTRVRRIGRERDVVPMRQRTPEISRGGRWRSMEMHFPPLPRLHRPAESRCGQGEEHQEDVGCEGSTTSPPFPHPSHRCAPTAAADARLWPRGKYQRPEWEMVRGRGGCAWRGEGLRVGRARSGLIATARRCRHGCGGPGGCSSQRWRRCGRRRIRRCRHRRRRHPSSLHRWRGVAGEVFGLAATLMQGRE